MQQVASGELMVDKDWRAEVAARLRAIQQALGATNAKMADLIGIGSDKGGTWGSYVEERAEFPVLHALTLEEKTGVNFRWIYTGQESWRNNPALSPKIEHALKHPEPPKRGPKPRHK